MTSRFVSIAAASLITLAAAAPFSNAQAQQMSVRIDTPDFGIRVGTPYPQPIYGPIYPAVVYTPPVVFAPAPVYYPPRYVVAPPRVLVPAPIYYRQPWFVPPGHAKRYWRSRHHHFD